MPRWLARLFMFVIIAGIPPLLVLVNVALFLTPQYLDFEYGKPDFPPAQIFSAQDRRYFATESILFERGDRNFEQLKGLGIYSDRELNHMVDVRVLIAQASVFRIMDTLMLALLLMALVSVPATRAMAAKALLGGALLTIGLFGTVGLFAAAFFNIFFFYFHKLFFEGDTGFFNYTDSLIQLYPERFWFDTAIALVGLTVVEAIILGLVGWAWRRAIARRGTARTT